MKTRRRDVFDARQTACTFATLCAQNQTFCFVLNSPASMAGRASVKINSTTAMRKLLDWIEYAVFDDRFQRAATQPYDRHDQHSTVLIHSADRPPTSATCRALPPSVLRVLSMLQLQTIRYGAIANYGIFVRHLASAAAAAAAVAVETVVMTSSCSFIQLVSK